MEKLSRSKLIRISDNLSDDDLLHMKNLCLDFISRSEAETINSGIDLFELLETKNKLSIKYVWLLADMLRVIDQNCLLEHLGLGLKTDEEFKNGRWQISMYRLCLTNLAMEIGEKEFKSLKRECNCTREDVTTFYQLITYLETRKKISPTKMDVLYRAFDITDLIHQKKINSILRSFQDLLQHSVLRMLWVVHQEDEISKEGIYRMTSQPRGICVIINNEHFENDDRNRKGTNIDADSLADVFGYLKFVVRQYNNLRSDEITSVLADISGQDHWLYDSFICCVLSHGSYGSVYGVDDNTVKIHTILEMFFTTNCPSLEGKPKLFFFQACQGSLSDGRPVSIGHPVNSDVREEEEDPAPSKSDLEPDFLLGYATTPGYRSFRSVHKGSWYIQNLVKNLRTLAARETLLDILVKVNKDVAEMNGVDHSLNVKQTPCPTFTLRKKLYLAESPNP